MDNEQLITYINDFHFLRPKFLWCFAPLLFVFVLYLINYKRSLSWQKLIREDLRKVIILDQQLSKINLPAFLMFFSLSLLIISVSGPTFKKKKLPTVINKAVVWVTLDLSQSMMTKDISPNRLERAKLKIRDLFAEKMNTKVGLVAYAGTPHVIFPPSLDKEIMVPYMTTIKPRIMPVKGTNYELLLSYMDTLIQKEIAPPTIIIVTDEIDQKVSREVVKFANKTNSWVQIWLASSFNGGFVPNPYNSKKHLIHNGKEVFSKADRSLLSQLEKNERISVVPITLDNSDVEVLKKHIVQHQVIKTEDDKKESDWRDDGKLLIYPLLIITLFWFRKGWMVNWGLMLLIFLSGCSEKYDNLWYSKDYQAQQKEKEGDYESAAKLYQDPSHKAFAYYKSGNYEAAAENYELDSTAISQYNLGLMYVELGNYEMAQAAFRIALKKDSTLSVATVSLNKVIKIIESNVADKSAFKNTQKDVQQAVKALSEKERKLSDHDYNKKKDKDADREKEKVVDPKKRKYKEQDWPNQNKKKEKDMNQVSAASMVMEKTNADPSEFLRKKFILQKRKYYPHIKNPEKKW
ncbi:VWA domain-containing protein [Flammeovirga agarivorans]|uniref:VWA domain-containing protein n=1 Tax=Flammeovirga agarivorans TaxID=2726742 RepID=A0A7X8SKL4_9BACT|nr:VWA domain-containing protein [Flammeovirga agarivorans]NLR91949.1 VWA domain-containing protein [Flammeovirga agarivorans]